ncbi:hypothetical protein CDIK_2838 [Cucumispora dikerogammari]|nr:hypothetical protein CDIK_2838 [Cucumispora dikerogammari]
MSIRKTLFQTTISAILFIPVSLHTYKTKEIDIPFLFPSQFITSDNITDLLWVMDDDNKLQVKSFELKGDRKGNAFLLPLLEVESQTQTEAFPSFHAIDDINKTLSEEGDIAGIKDNFRGGVTIHKSTGFSFNSPFVLTRPFLLSQPHRDKRFLYLLVIFPNLREFNIEKSDILFKGKQVSKIIINLEYIKNYPLVFESTVDNVTRLYTLELSDEFNRLKYTITLDRTKSRYHIENSCNNKLVSQIYNTNKPSISNLDTLNPNLEVCQTITSSSTIDLKYKDGLTRVGEAKEEGNNITSQISESRKSSKSRKRKKKLSKENNEMETSTLLIPPELESPNSLIKNEPSTQAIDSPRTSTSEQTSGRDYNSHENNCEIGNEDKILAQEQTVIDKKIHGTVSLDDLEKANETIIGLLKLGSLRNKEHIKVNSDLKRAISEAKEENNKLRALLDKIKNTVCHQAMQITQLQKKNDALKRENSEFKWHEMEKLTKRYAQKHSALLISLEQRNIDAIDLFKKTKELQAELKVKNFEISVKTIKIKELEKRLDEEETWREGAELLS